MQCIVCKQEIIGLNETTQYGPVHSGACMEHYLEIQENLNESDENVLVETQLL